jgi:hypothetical protein
MFLRQLAANKVQVSAAGFCAINKGIIVSVSSVVVSPKFRRFLDLCNSLVNVSRPHVVKKLRDIKYNSELSFLYGSFGKMLLVTRAVPIQDRRI